MVFSAYARKSLTRWALAAALGCAVLAAPAPFSALSPALSTALGADLGADLAVPPVAGLGAGPARALGAALAEMLAAQGFRAESGFTITGRAEVRRQGETTAWVALNWKVTAADGRTHNTAAREILVDQARWARGEALTMRYAAAETAPDVLKILARLGIEPESVPAQAPGPTTSETTPASAPEPPPEPSPEPWPGGEPPVFLIHPVVITGVGVANSGGAELALAMGRALRALGAETAPAPGDADRAETGVTHIVRAEAAVSEVSGDMQQIRIIWHVAQVSGGASGASGGALGTAEQQNEVPAGALAGPWGGLADQIARAAADGVRRLFIVQPTAEGG